MIDVKLIGKPKKGSATVAGSTAAGIAREADHAATADRADVAARADLASRAQNLATDSTDWGIIDGKVTVAKDEALEHADGLARRLDEDKLSRRQADTAQGLITFLRGIGLGEKYGITEDGAATLASVLIRGLYGMDSDGNATVGCLTMPGYEPGMKGLKMWLDEQGKSHAQVDFIEVLAKAVYHELEVRRMVGISGDQMQSAAASVLLDALPIVEGGKVLGWKCHLKTDDGTMQTLNTWVGGDQAYCHVSNLRLGSSTNAANRTYWRVVSEVAQKTESEEAYIVISNVAPYYHEGMADAPQAGDSVVQFGYNAAWALAHGIEPSKYANRMNVRMSTVSDDGGPTEALYRAVSGFDYSIEQNAVKYVSGERIFMRSKDMIWLSESGAMVPNVIHMGDWPQGGTTAHVYESWQSGGATWLCVRDTTDEPSATSPDWRVYAAKGEAGGSGLRVEGFASAGSSAYTEGQTDWRATFELHVWEDDVEVTDDLPSTRFVWSRVSEYPEGDDAWGIRHSDGGSTLSVTYDDLIGDTSFICRFLSADGREVLARQTF